MQVSKYLESNTKFSFNNHKATNKFGEEEFFKWSSKNFYRTSYNDMAAKVTAPLLSHPFAEYDSFVCALLSRALRPDRPQSSPATRATCPASRSTTSTSASA